MVKTNRTNRRWGPFFTTVRWLQIAATVHPYRNAAYAAKLDDDCFINVPELTVHLQLLRDRPMVYYGVFYYAQWDKSGYSVAAAGYSMRVKRRQGACNCSKPYPFAAAPAQILSADLTAAIATSPMVNEYIKAAGNLLADPQQGNRSSEPAAEDSFIGVSFFCLSPP